MPEAWKPPVPLLPLVAEGDTAEALITAAKNTQLLVLGTRGRSPLAGLLLGSVSQTCAAAPCPAVLAKKKEGGLPGRLTRSVPDWLGRFADVAVRHEEQKPVE